jgi:hypothetical protein
MKRRLTEPFGKAGLTVAILALVMALVGGAYAAGGLTKAQEKQVTKIAKKYAGKPGAPGTAGANGTNGTSGKDGGSGQNGAPGTPGGDGESVEVNAYAGPQCPASENEEGAELTNASGTAYACNGAEGSPWTAGGTLPSGKTETGSWTLFGGEFATSLSFTIPLASPLAGANVHLASNGSGHGDLTSGSSTVENYKNLSTNDVLVAGDQISGAGIPAGTTITEVGSGITGGGSGPLTLSAAATASATAVALTASPPALCQGSTEDPKADQGHLCVYVETLLGSGGPLKIETPAEDGFVKPGASKAGAILTSGGFSGATWGTWAVTAP